MIATEKKYTLSQIHKGMKIDSKEQLSNIYDTWIILVRKQDEKQYTIGFIGKETNEESSALYTKDNIICPIYNDSMDLDEDIYYEE